MLFSGKENFFMCLVAFQKMFWKIFSDVWLYSWKYHKKYIFYLLLTFSHIFSVTKRIYNIIYSSKHKQNPEKNCQIRKIEGEIAIGTSTWRSTHRTKIEASIAIVIGTTTPANDVGGRWCRDRFFLSPSLSLSLSLSFFYFPRPEVIWSENRNGKSFPLFWLFDQLEMLFSLTEFEVTTKHPHFLENHFRNQFEVNSNTALVVFVICHKNK